MPLTLQKVQDLISGAIERATELETQITVAVVDEGGHLKAFGRMDGVPPLTVQVAQAKANSVAIFGYDGATLRRMQESAPSFFAQLAQVVQTPILAGGGTALIREEGIVVGAIAVSGAATSAQDDECVEAALAVLSS
ncbi:GlcG/HbpS family heme-binding protein [Microbacterium sp. A196]|uniref:GlcG/HbpS family heme-binding protein n=1 Tax=unclassified Microbacterium TaxID=2609290 RepID=UPI003F3F9E91